MSYERHPRVLSQNCPPDGPQQWESTTNLASKMSDFYLHTPTVNQTPSFPQTPFAQGPQVRYAQNPQTPGLTSPASLSTPGFVQSTPNSVSHFALNTMGPERPPDMLTRDADFSPMAHSGLDMSGGLNIAYGGEFQSSHQHSTSVDTIPEEEYSGEMANMPMAGGMSPNEQRHQHFSQQIEFVKTEPVVKHKEYPPHGQLSFAKPELVIKHDDCSPNDSHPYVKPPSFIEHDEHSPIGNGSSQGFISHDTSPFTHKESHSTISGNEPITIEDLLKDDPFPELEKPKAFEEGDDDSLSSFFDFEDDAPVKKTPSASKTRSSKNTPTKPPRHKIPTFSAVSAEQSGSKHIRKCKSFSHRYSSHNTAGPTFSFEECSNEFHVTEGNYAFQDETARLSMQLGPGLAPKKNSKSAAANENHHFRPVLKKSKTTSNLCSPRSGCRSPKLLKNMEQGLVSFQVKLKNPK
ncbi:hypothetical protein ACI3LY_000044 [Candidozyma auris]|uniref:Uncharacterized protein n=2 Tax=Candidozyma auris TaxID=498019 RepID=A0AB36WCU5_CANAR|nr:hypothetical protein CJI97_001031 [[Candida] auris]PIS58511.1 hypothetical protein B9J08_001011 [[Candida] auris]QWW23743.1 hypothetical protein CA7LBN_002544 [[Candida] auris]